MSGPAARPSRALAIASLLMAFTSACSASAPHETGRETAGRDDGAAVLENFRVYTTAWNRGVTPILRAYLDDDVFAEEMIDVIEAHLGELEAAIDGLAQDVAALQDSVLVGLLDPVVLNYHSKLGAVRQLHAALIDGDEDRELLAADRMTQLATEGQRLVLALLNGLAHEGFITAAERDQARSSLLNALATQTPP